MNIFDRIGGEDYEQVVFCHDRASGLRAIVAIHSTRLGPALGGTRFHAYPSEEAGLEDVLRLAKGMTYKAAVAGLDLGGGKAVILGNPATDRSEALLRAFGRFVHSLNGRYVTAEDVGTTQADMDLIRRETTFVTGVSRELGGSGDPSEATSYGLLQALKATARRLWGSTDLVDRHVVVLGVGKVGGNLVRHLVEERAHVTISDINAGAVARVAEQFDVEVVDTDKAHAVACDVLSPCAMGGLLSPSTIPELRCAAVVGSANNQLADPSCAKLLHEAGVLYGPDYVVNAGGVINIAEELGPRGYHRARARQAVRAIFDTTDAVYETAEREGITPLAAADRMAERRIAALSGVQLLRTGTGR